MTDILHEFYYNAGTLLKGVNMPDPDLIISSRCIEIYGNDPKDYCFLYSKETLESFRFETNPQITKIGKYAFLNCKKIQQIDLSACSKLTVICEYAFQGCSSVIELLLPEGLQYIKNRAFQGISIQSIEIPTTVIDINDYGLDISKLSNITFREGSKLLSLSNLAFSGTSLVEFTVPESVKSIAGTFLSGVTTLRTISVHKKNQYFVSDNYAVYTKDYSTIVAFAANSTIEYEINPKTMSINLGVFCSALCKSITIPQCVTYIGPYAFASTKSLEQIILPPNLTTIQQYCFINSGLTSIDIPSKVTFINDCAFINCLSLKTIIIPSNLKTVGGFIFPSDPSINFTIKDDALVKIDDQTLIMAKDNSSISLLLDSAATTIKIPSQVKRIKTLAFSNKKLLVSIICDGTSELEIIEDSAFSNCEMLTSIPFFPKLREINRGAFYKTNLPNVFTFPSSLIFVGNKAFSEVKTLERIKFTSNTTSLNIQDSAFAGCTSLKNVSFEECSSNISLGQNVFEGCNSLSTFNVINNIKMINSGCFMNSGLKYIVFENNITSFDNLPAMLLKGCTNITEIDIPKNVISIGNECFRETSIRHITIPNSVESLYSQCFRGCTFLERIYISSTCNLFRIFPEIVEDCTSLSYISDFSSNHLVCQNSTIYDINFGRVYLHAPACRDNYISFDRRLRSVADSAFINSIYIEMVHFVDSSVISIGRRAFESCIRLKHISIPLSVTSIGNNAFLNCKSLKCGVLFQNKTEDFIQTLVSSGIPKISLRSCDTLSCKLQQSPNSPIAILVFIAPTLLGIF
ncbi:surface antigen BspA-like [Trichomonas vaginalis G3]|uniref:Surface antigen BspA-like n=1 Tax=Trichomonas vaginalis (strain ATCC PRA-98 / G3) TaxID=412133 RepID=A2EV28_TRIV3|nr:regulation of response to stimulus [Trichomonas vaginalis G3]EAY03478.1 surface antigen BspA-like [Trichomonas vaginalis G3]KAI5486886.1 regulation of response to stimulus [Trichomonas vaginalis G3]|eukprot:XP_001315701.1 surface antigen BspA-like [Trichomonas vaginalis G3]